MDPAILGLMIRRELDRRKLAKMEAQREAKRWKSLTPEEKAKEIRKRRIRERIGKFLIIVIMITQLSHFDFSLKHF